jgi:hypothetical protein
MPVTITWNQQQDSHQLIITDVSREFFNDRAVKHHTKMLLQAILNTIDTPAASIRTWDIRAHMLRVPSHLLDLT